VIDFDNLSDSAARGILATLFPYGEFDEEGFFAVKKNGYISKDRAEFQVSLKWPHRWETEDKREGEGIVDLLTTIRFDGNRPQAIKQFTPIAETVTLRERVLASTSVATLLRREFPPEERLLGDLVTKNTRTFIVGASGTGKTHFGLGMCGGMVSGQGYLHFTCDRPSRVLLIDGEMPLSLLRKRVQDTIRRLGGDEETTTANWHYISWQEPLEIPGVKWGPLNTPEGRAYINKLIEIIQPDSVVFDNVQSLVEGEMKEEAPWNEAMELVYDITARNVGQTWIDHTGHDTSRQYGSSRKSWQFDTVGILKPLTQSSIPGELAFSISFEHPGKARRRTPDNWQEFSPYIIRLKDDVWTSEPADPSEKPPASRTSGGRTDTSVILRCLRKALDESGTPSAVGNEGADRSERPVVSEEDWRRVFYEDPSMKQKKTNTKRMAFTRGKDSLLNAGKIGSIADLVWIKP
jgi:AAA domain